MTNLVQFPGLGLSFTINRVAFSIGDFAIYWYGILIGTGMLLAIVVYACAALWAFASGSALRAWAGIATPALLFWLGVQWLGAPA